jgi:hypothetical protein
MSYKSPINPITITNTWQYVLNYITNFNRTKLKEDISWETLENVRHKATLVKVRKLCWICSQSDWHDDCHSVSTFYLANEHSDPLSSFYFLQRGSHLENNLISLVRPECHCELWQRSWQVLITRCTTKKSWSQDRSSQRQEVKQAAQVK